MSQENFFFEAAPGANVAGTIFAFQAPSSTQGGGVTIEDLTIMNSAAGTISFTFKKYSSAGTPALNGTVASTGGTVAANVPLACTMGPNNYLSSGEWLQIAWSGGGTPAADSRIVGHYKMGREAV